MKVLALDTSTDVASAAVMEDGRLLGEYTLDHKKTHSQKIMVMVERLLDDLEINPLDIDVFAAAAGPGSFTGLRIGTATIKALAHAAGKDTVSVGTLEAMAYNIPCTDAVIAPLIDARRGNVYAALYKCGDPPDEIIAPCGVSVEEFAERCAEYDAVVFVGDGAEVNRAFLEERLGEKALFPPASLMGARASSTAAAATDKARRGETLSYAELKPQYIKKSQAEKELEEREKNK